MAVSSNQYSQRYIFQYIHFLFFLFLLFRGTIKSILLIASDSFFALVVDCSSTEDSPAVSAINSPPLIDPRHLPPLCTKTVRVCRRRSFAKKSRIPIGVKLYSVAELQTATNSFSEENLLGEGSLGSVYKAEFPNGQVQP